ncbi:hypothetical protein AaE_003110 [Aphanomyces astaci]|uniref:V-SNARE coiled-coil homology domain-containing protein n=1 Tax=Aphanomyces astaci TaxID=112090 RepID=A0A6A5ALW5_APHAT|nr:hypothetical protein AaE_003110 [Aphanomyces astaci]
MTKLKLDMQRDFGAILKTHMEMLSSQGGMLKLEALRKDLDGVKDSMQHNIGKVLERGDKIDLLVDKSESLKFFVGRCICKVQPQPASHIVASKCQIVHSRRGSPAGT